MTEIAKCPYCGSYPKIEYCTSYLGRTFDYQVQCQVCGAIGPQKDIPEATIEAWNKVARMRETLGDVKNQFKNIATWCSNADAHWIPPYAALIKIHNEAESGYKLIEWILKEEV